MNATQPNRINPDHLDLTNAGPLYQRRRPAGKQTLLSVVVTTVFFLGLILVPAFMCFVYSSAMPLLLQAR